jgi:hypothetical protein
VKRIDGVHVLFYRVIAVHFKRSHRTFANALPAQRKFKERRVFLIRSICAAFLAFFLLPSAGASAGDYSVTYAIDANGKNDAGKIETCVYDKACLIESASAGLSISMDFPRPDHKWVQLEVMGPPGCCYSYDAIRRIYLEIKPGLLRVPIYDGRARRVNEFVQNKRFGVLYLEFSYLR